MGWSLPPQHNFGHKSKARGFSSMLTGGQVEDNLFLGLSKYNIVYSTMGQGILLLYGVIYGVQNSVTACQWHPMASPCTMPYSVCYSISL